MPANRRVGPLSRPVMRAAWVIALGFLGVALLAAMSLVGGGLATAGVCVAFSAMLPVGVSKFNDIRRQAHGRVQFGPRGWERSSSEAVLHRIISRFALLGGLTVIVSYAIWGSGAVRYGVGVAIAAAVLGVPFAMWLYRRIGGD